CTRGSGGERATCPRRRSPLACLVAGSSGHGPAPPGTSRARSVRG
ncbi:MAG: hypothetical protein AVDCRST_MAG57-3717, partial [uncultured Blastococcus sp.]